MQGKFEPELIKNILVLSIFNKLSQREISSRLSVNLKTVNRYVKKSQQLGLKYSDLAVPATDLAIRLNSNYKLKVENNSDLYIQKTIHQNYFLTKKLLSESFELFKANSSYADCYKYYLNQRPNRQHYSMNEFRIKLKTFMQKEILENTSFFDIEWNKNDVEYLSSLVSPCFLFHMQLLSKKNGVLSCMKLLNFIHGNKKFYKEINNYLDFSSTISLKVIWRILLDFNSLSKRDPKQIDKDFLSYIEERKQKFQRDFFKRLGFNGEISGD